MNTLIHLLIHLFVSFCLVFYPLSNTLYSMNSLQANQEKLEKNDHTLSFIKQEYFALLQANLTYTPVYYLGYTALHWCIIKKYYKYINTFLSHPFLLHYLTQNENSNALDIALNHKEYSIVSRLWQLGVRPHSINSLHILNRLYNHKSGIHIIQKNSYFAHDTLQRLSAHNPQEIIALANLEGSSKNLLNAAYNGNLMEAVNSICLGACVDSFSHKGKTALHHATQRGQYDIVRLLLDYGAKTTLKDENGLTAFDITQKTHHHPLALLLLPEQQRLFYIVHHNIYDYLPFYFFHLPKNTNTTLPPQDYEQKTPLHKALLLGHTRSALNLLLIYSPYRMINIGDKDNMTPLHYAVLMKNPELVSFLLEMGADPELQNNSQYTARDLADAYFREYHNKNDKNNEEVKQEEQTKIAQCIAILANSLNQAYYHHTPLPPLIRPIAPSSTSAGQELMAHPIQLTDTNKISYNSITL